MTEVVKSKPVFWLDDAADHDALGKPITRRENIQLQCGDLAVAYVEEAIRQIAKRHQYAADAARESGRIEAAQTFGEKHSITPANFWSLFGEKDPHGDQYNHERSKLALGRFSDDEIANGIFMNFDQRPDMMQVIAGKAFTPQTWMTAGKERIRWLSRQVTQLLQQNKQLEAELAQIKDAQVDRDLNHRANDQD